MCVDKGVLDVFVTENLHDMKNVLCFMILHRSFVVSQRFEGYHVDSLVLEFSGYPFALLSEASGKVLLYTVLEHEFVSSR